VSAFTQKSIKNEMLRRFAPSIVTSRALAPSSTINVASLRSAVRHQ
jgi:hypothetical protein